MIIPRSEHGISRKQICDNALKVLYRLRSAGFGAYLVGGGVRDLLLGIQPKDFDIATNATPEEIRELFRNCRLIGRRFRLAHIHFGRDYIEVATFRGAGSGKQAAGSNGRVLDDNVYGTIEEDAQRRDFTVNALYYNIDDFSVRDFVGGVADVEQRLLSMIGDPEERYREDPVRMLRVVRFAAKLDFAIEEKTLEPIAKLGDLLDDIPPARLFEEVLKLFLTGHAEASLRELMQHDLLRQLFPQTAKLLASPEGEQYLPMLQQAARDTDARIAADKPVTPAFLFATMLWPAYDLQRKRLVEKEHLSIFDAFQLASDRVIRNQLDRISIPRRFSTPMREIWSMQNRLPRNRGKRGQKLMTHPRFRAAYDFLLLRAVIEPDMVELAEWWTKVQDVSAGAQKKMFFEGDKPRKRRRKRRADSSKQAAT